MSLNQLISKIPVFSIPTRKTWYITTEIKNTPDDEWKSNF